MSTTYYLVTKVSLKFVAFKVYRILRNKF